MSVSCVVTTKVLDQVCSRIWQENAPIGIGSPIRWVLEKTPMGVRIRHIGTPAGRSKLRACQNFTFAQVKNGIRLNLNKIELSVRLKNSLENGFGLPVLKLENDQTSEKNFLRSLKLSSVGLLSLLVFFLLWGAVVKPAPEVIPAQYAKIIFSKPKGAQGGASTGAHQAQRPSSQKPLRRAVNSLLKGGMTRLLAQSDFLVHGKNQNPGGLLFEKKMDILRTGHIKSSDLEGRAITVASLGGDGSLNKFENSGYRQGGHASVAGQGKAHVSLDTQGSAVEEGLTKDEVGEVIHHHLSEVRYCYESTMLKTPDLEGKLIIQFKIGELGAIKTAAIQTSSLPDPRLDDCVLRRLVTWKFPSPKGGIDVAVTYPFIFKTLGR